MVQSYGPRVVGVYSVTLWDTVKFEVLQAQDDDLAQESLKVLSAVAFVLSRGSREGLLTYLKQVVKESNEHLEDAPTKQSEAASRILFAVSSSSWQASNVIVSGVVPHIAVLYQGTEDMQKKRGLVQALADLLRANCKVFGDWQHNPLQHAKSTGNITEVYGAASDNTLRQYSSTILATLLGALSAEPTQNVSYRLTLVDAALQLAKGREILSDDDISKIIRTLGNIILSLLSHSKDEVKTAAIIAITEIAQQKPQLVIDQAFPMFLSKIPDNDVGYAGTYLPVLEAFATIGVQETISSTAILRLQNKWNIALTTDASNAHLRAILSALLYVLQNNIAVAKDDVDALNYYKSLLVPLVTLCVNDLPIGRLDDQAFGLIGRISNVIMRNKATGLHLELAPQIYAVGLGTGPSDARYLLVSVHLLGSLQPWVSTGTGAETILQRLIDIQLDPLSSVNTKAAALQHLCLNINKMIPAPDLTRVLAPILDPLLERFDGRTETQPITMLFAILKALILRNAPQQSRLLLRLLGGLSDPKVGHAVAQGFSILLEPDDILSKENHCAISPLYKQKTFAIAVPEISSAFAAADAAVKKNYLVALSGILQWLPYSAFAAEVASLTPLLLLTLELDDEHKVKAGTIDKLSAILQNGTILEERASSLITRLLHISSSKTDPPKVRETALQCLTLVASSMKTETIMPYRKQVVKRLTVPIDDKRRAVRAEAVKCRTKWISVDEGASDDE
jgi:DNA repair/transcription protein MET18/MMS19